MAGRALGSRPHLGGGVVDRKSDTRVGALERRGRERRGASEAQTRERADEDALVAPVGPRCLLVRAAPLLHHRGQVLSLDPVSRHPVQNLAHRRHARVHVARRASEADLRARRPCGGREVPLLAILVSGAYAVHRPHLAPQPPQQQGRRHGAHPRPPQVSLLGERGIIVRKGLARKPHHCRRLLRDPGADHRMQMRRLPRERLCVVGRAAAPLQPRRAWHALRRHGTAHAAHGQVGGDERDLAGGVERAELRLEQRAELRLGGQRAAEDEGPFRRAGVAEGAEVEPRHGLQRGRRLQHGELVGLVEEVEARVVAHRHAVEPLPEHVVRVAGLARRRERARAGARGGGGRH